MAWFSVDCRSDPQAPSARECHTFNAVGGDVLSFGGNDRSTRFGDIHVLDTLRMKWSRRPLRGGEPPYKRSAHTCSLVDGRYLYVFGGWDGTRELGDLMVYDIETSRWSFPKTTGSPPCARHFHVTAFLGRRLYVFGGFDGVSWRNDVLTLNVDTLAWDDVRFPPGMALPGPRASSCISVIGDDALFLYAGYDGADFLRDAWVLRTPGGSAGLRSHAWERMPEPPEGVAGLPFWPDARSGHAADVLDGRLVVVVGGRHKGGRLNDVVCWDIAARCWVPVTPAGEPFRARKTHAVSIVGHRMFLFGGHNGEGWQGDLSVLDLAPVLADALKKPAVPLPLSSLLPDLASLTSHVLREPLPQPTYDLGTSLRGLPSLRFADCPVRGEDAEWSVKALTEGSGRAEAASGGGLAWSPAPASMSWYGGLGERAAHAEAFVLLRGKRVARNGCSLPYEPARHGRTPKAASAAAGSSDSAASVRDEAASTPFSVDLALWAPPSGRSGAAVSPAGDAPPGTEHREHSSVPILEGGTPASSHVAGSAGSYGTGGFRGAAWGPHSVLAASAAAPLVMASAAPLPPPPAAGSEGTSSPEPPVLGPSVFAMHATAARGGAGAVPSLPPPMPASAAAAAGPAPKWGWGEEGPASPVPSHGSARSEVGVGGGSPRAPPALLVSEAPSDPRAGPLGAPPSARHGGLDAPARAVLGSGLGGAPFTDVAFLVGGRAIPLHRVILAARSSVFRQMLAGPWAESHAGRLIPLPDVPLPAFAALVRYIYTDQLPPERDLPSLTLPLLQLAGRFELPHLSALLTTHALACLSPESAPSLLASADELGAAGSALRTAVLSYCAEHFPKLVESRPFRALPPRLLAAACAWCARAHSRCVEGVARAPEVELPGAPLADPLWLGEEDPALLARRTRAFRLSAASSAADPLAAFLADPASAATAGVGMDEEEEGADGGVEGAAEEEAAAGPDAGERCSPAGDTGAVDEDDAPVASEGADAPAAEGAEEEGGRSGGDTSSSSEGSSGEEEGAGLAAGRLGGRRDAAAGGGAAATPTRVSARAAPLGPRGVLTDGADGGDSGPEGARSPETALRYSVRQAVTARLRAQHTLAVSTLEPEEEEGDAALADLAAAEDATAADAGLTPEEQLIAAAAAAAAAAASFAAARAESAACSRSTSAGRGSRKGGAGGAGADALAGSSSGGETPSGRRKSSRALRSARAALAGPLSSEPGAGGARASGDADEAPAPEAAAAEGSGETARSSLGKQHAGSKRRR